MEQEVVQLNFTEIEKPLYESGAHAVSDTAIRLQISNVTLHISNATMSIPMLLLILFLIK